jgi:hypothetical protein
MYKLIEVLSAFDRVNNSTEKRKEFISFLPKIRTNEQNRSMHKFFEIVSAQLNDIGHTFNFDGIKGLKMQLPYTPEIVKNFIWRPIQSALFDKESTTRLTTKEVSQIAEIIIKFFADYGIIVEFPSKESVKNNYHE